MDLNQLRTLAIERFGERLERATPEALAQFLAEIQPELPGSQSGGTFELDGAAGSYEEAMRGYFAEMLAARPERAAASLWVTAAEMWVDAVLSLERDQ